MLPESVCKGVFLSAYLFPSYLLHLVLKFAQYVQLMRVLKTSFYFGSTLSDTMVKNVNVTTRSSFKSGTCLFPIKGTFNGEL